MASYYSHSLVLVITVEIVGNSVDRTMTLLVDWMSVGCGSDKNSAPKLENLKEEHKHFL
jgi:predicted exporter